MEINSLQVAQSLYNESKFWIALCGLMWSAFKGVAWIRALKENDLHHLQLGVNDVKTGIGEVKTGLDRQTDAVVNEIKELRADFRAFYPQPVRARASKGKGTSTRSKK